MKQVYIIDYIRTPIAKFQGGLSDVRADDFSHRLKGNCKEKSTNSRRRNRRRDFRFANAGEDKPKCSKNGFTLAELPIKIGGRNREQIMRF